MKRMLAPGLHRAGVQPTHNSLVAVAAGFLLPVVVETRKGEGMQQEWGACIGIVTLTKKEGSKCLITCRGTCILFLP